MKNLRLKSVRVLANMSQAELAKKVGVSKQTISGIKTGENKPSIDLCVRICKVLGRTLDELFWED